MPAPSKWNRRTKARNDRRAAARSGGGRTASEAAFGRSQRAAGRTVSRTNTRVPKANRPRAVRTPLALPEVQTSIERLRQKYGSETLDRGNREARQVNTEVSQDRDRAERKLENAALRSMPTRGEALKAAPAVRQSTQLNAEGTRVERLAGATQVGNEPLRAVMGAAKRGRIKRRGKQFTTPKVRRTERKVRRAKRQVRKARAAARSGVTGPLTAGQKKFVREFSKRTGINPRVAGAWVLAEMSGPYAQGREAEGNHNWLNIAYFDSGPGEITKDPTWRDPSAAAKASADFLKGRRFGPSEGIRAILPNAKGRSDEAQIQAIAASDWASSGYDGGNLLRGTRDLIGYTPPSGKAKARLAKAEARVGKLERVAAELGLSPNRERQRGPVRWGPKRAKQISGAWAGTQAILERAGKGFNISSRKRDASHYLSQQNPGSDHNTANTNAYAHDIPAVGDENGIPIAEAYHKRLGLNEPLAIGTYNYYTSRKYPGYQFQILWNVSGHYDHVHVGAKWTGEDLPAGTYAGGDGSTYSSGASGGSYVAAGGGGSAPAGSGPARRGPTPRQLLRRLGYKVTSKGIERTGLAAGISGEGGKEETLSTAEMKRRYGIK